MTDLLTRPNNENVRFAVLGDSKGKDHGINETVLRKIMKQLSSCSPRPEYLIVMGDSVAGSHRGDLLKTQLAWFKNLILSYCPEIQILPVTGNHEVNNNPVDNSSEMILEKIYCELHPDGSLEGFNNTAYYMDTTDARLIVLNAFHCGEINKVTGEQLEWFRRAAAVNKKYKFLFIHSPAFPTGAHLGNCLDCYADKRNILWKIIDESGIDIVFSGHEHNYSRRVIDPSFSTEGFKLSNNVIQIISGGGGEKLRDSYKSRKGVIVQPKAVHHFVIVDVTKRSIAIKAVEVNGKIIDSFEVIK